jgi:hypothetical protein
MIDKDTEERLLLPTICKMLSSRLHGITAMIDYGIYDEGACEPFELFFVVNENCSYGLDPHTADGSQTIYQLAQTATALIIERYATFYKEQPADIGHIGFCRETAWAVGKEAIPEMELMVGDVDETQGIPCYWRFWLRFAPKMTQIEGRCLFALPEDRQDEEDGPFIY